MQFCDLELEYFAMFYTSITKRDVVFMEKKLHILLLSLITITTFFNITFGKLGIFNLIFSIIILVFIELIKRRKYIKLSSHVKSILLFFLIWLNYAMVQIIFIVDHDSGYKHFIVMILGIILICIISAIVNSKEMLVLLYRIWGIALLIIILVGWFELYTGIKIGESPIYFADKINVTYYNPNNYSFVLIISLPIIMYWISHENLYSKITGFFMYLSSFYFIYINETRLGLIIFSFATMLYLLSLMKRRKKILLLFSFFICIATFYNWNLIVGTLELLTTLNFSDNSFNERAVLLNWAFQIFFQHPFGVGPGQLEYYMPIVGSNVHNLWIEILVNYGIIIFLGFIMFFVIFIFKGLTVRKYKKIKLLITPIFWTVIIFIPASVGPSSIYDYGILWFVFAVMLSTINVISKEEYLNQLSVSQKAF